MLDTKDVAEMFKRCNLAVYAEARRIYYREVNLNPCKKYPKQVLQRIEWWFWDWFAYDCAVSGIGLTGNESEDLRIELQYGPGAGISPFLALAEFMYDKDERIVIFANLMTPISLRCSGFAMPARSKVV